MSEETPLGVASAHAVELHGLVRGLLGDSLWADEVAVRAALIEARQARGIVNVPAAVAHIDRGLDALGKLSGATKCVSDLLAELVDECRQAKAASEAAPALHVPVEVAPESFDRAEDIAPAQGHLSASMNELQVQPQLMAPDMTDLPAEGEGDCAQSAPAVHSLVVPLPAPVSLRLRAEGAPTEEEQRGGNMPARTGQLEPEPEQMSHLAPLEWGPLSPAPLVGNAKQDLEESSAAISVVRGPRGEEYSEMAVLAFGLFGVVQLVRRQRDRRVFAMKVMAKKRVVKMKQLKQLRNERNLLKEVDHHCVVGLIDAFQDPHNVYLVLEYCQAGDLASLQGRFDGHILPVRFARFYTASVAAAFEYLHSKCILYRDLKAENVVIGMPDCIPCAGLVRAR
jgi:hypothetical protein